MAISPDIEEDTIEGNCEHRTQGEAVAIKSVDTSLKMYDINDPPDAEDQFAMFPDRVKGQDNLAYILMKMEGSTEYVPIVFCIACAAVKVIQYCNGGYEYQYEPCLIDKDFYCPQFYAELTRRMLTDALERDVWDGLFRPPTRKTRHAEGCVHSSRPDFVVQGKEGMARSIYFRHCQGIFRNAAMQILDLGSPEDAIAPNISSWFEQRRTVGPHMVSGLEWKETTRVENILVVDSITHL